MGLIKLAVAGAAGYALYKYTTQSREGSQPAFSAGEGGARIRNAGRESMRDAPRRWSKTDEASDASFPASDPPSTY